MLESYRELVVWQQSIQLCVSIYHVTAGFPREELFGLTSQLRRSAVSIPSNIAEGYGRASKGEYKHFLSIARGSNHEAQTQLVIAKELKYASNESIYKAESLSAKSEEC
jgi:four helix bundle protein